MDSPDSTSVTVTTTTTTTATTTSTSNSVLGSRKRVKLSPRISQHRQLQQEIQWRNPAQAKIYNRQLLDSLRNLTINSSNRTTNDPSSPPPPSQPPRAIKDAADSALAMTARGQSRWSRAILSRRWRMRKVVMVKPKVKKRPKKEEEGEGRVRGEKRKVRDRLRLLGHLVPGCRKVSMEDLLEETADYVAALELQVKAMKALSDTLSAANNVSGTDSSPPPADVAAASSRDN